MDKLLITGGSGFLGTALAKSACGWDVVVTRHSSGAARSEGCKAVDMDITEREQVIDVVTSVCPAAIIHTAAIPDLAQCNDNRELARQVNVDGAANVAFAAQKCGAKLVFTSTDLVYSGTEGNYTETAAAEPSCYYGQTKLEAESVIASLFSNYCIARTALIYGKSLTAKKCFAEMMLLKMAEGAELKLFSDEYRSPVYLEDLCRVLLKMAADDEARGIYNIGGPRRISRYEFGLLLAELFNLDGKCLRPTKIDQSLFGYHRPEDCSMSISKAVRQFGDIFLSPREGLERMKLYEIA